MAIPVLIIGKSGSGKSASLRNLNREKTAIFNVLGKPLPFRGKMDEMQTDDYEKIIRGISKTEREIIVIDDAGYLITNQFMKNHSNSGSGNGVFLLYNQLADNFWKLVQAIKDIKDNKRVYIIMHEDKSENGDVKPKTIGKLLDDKVCIEGMFTLCLRCAMNDGRHVFLTQSSGYDTAKSPIGMFDALEIDNDLLLVDKAICDYYEIEKKEDDKQ